MTTEAKANPQIAAMLGAALAYAKELKSANVRDRTVQLTVDGLVYTSTKLPASVGLELWPRVAALLGAALTRAAATGEVEEGTDYGAAIVKVADRAMRDSLIPLVRDLLARMKCGKLYSTGEAGDVLSDFDEHFAGEYLHLLKVCVFAIAHNLRGPTYGVR